MKNRSGGFTFIEMVMTMGVAVILLDVALSATGPALDRMSVSSARTTFVALHARARARAVERGRTVRLSVDPVADSAWVFDQGVVVEAVDFGATDVDLRSKGPWELCLTPRGYADTNCNSFAYSAGIGFVRNRASSWIEVKAFGQLVMGS